MGCSAKPMPNTGVAGLGPGHQVLRHRPRLRQRPERTSPWASPCVSATERNCVLSTKVGRVLTPKLDAPSTNGQYRRYPTVGGRLRLFLRRCDARSRAKHAANAHRPFRRPVHPRLRRLHPRSSSGRILPPGHRQRLPGAGILARAESRQSDRVRNQRDRSDDRRCQSHRRRPVPSRRTVHTAGAGTAR